MEVVGLGPSGCCFVIFPFIMSYNPILVAYTCHVSLYFLLNAAAIFQLVVSSCHGAIQ